ncbi:nucleolar protein,Nop52 [Xylariales sp. PMI_506]|nr:nucleolar protein,Nop52 [Xylariales sp. PMI_506]
MAADERSMPFIKHLANSDRKIRTEALDSLRTFLRAATTARSLTELDNLKLWKGLFYSVYMCDRPIPQQNLCAELAALVDVLPEDAVAPWLVGFWDVMSREWTSIDVLRMEKFLLLVRRVFAASLKWVREKDGAAKKSKKKAAAAAPAEQQYPRAERMLEVLREWPFEGTGNLSKVAVGLRLHVMDIWVDEAERIGMLGDKTDEENPVAPTPADIAFLEALKTIIEVQAKKSPSKPVRARAKDSLADERLPWYVAKEGSEDEDEDMKNGEEDGWGGFDD